MCTFTRPHLLGCGHPHPLSVNCRINIRSSTLSNTSTTKTRFSRRHGENIISDIRTENKKDLQNQTETLSNCLSQKQGTFELKDKSITLPKLISYLQKENLQIKSSKQDLTNCTLDGSSFISSRWSSPIFFSAINRTCRHSPINWIRVNSETIIIFN